MEHNPVFQSHIRPRRMRTDRWTRALYEDCSLKAHQLVQPIFVHDKDKENYPIESLPGISRLSTEYALNYAENCLKAGVHAIAVFPVIDSSQKSLHAEQSYAETGLVQKLTAAFKRHFANELLVITDVALDPYTVHGQDGILGENGNILNDETVGVLCKQALSQARAGADIVAPSDMMDHRIGKIRATLDKNGFENTKILSYAAKYASSFYGPFRDAVGSKKSLGNADKKTYQMNPANRREALTEARLDVNEGADMLMVKPAGMYLDIIAALRAEFELPIVAYQVSGEYAMIKAAAANGWLNDHECMYESLLAIRRAGADAIFTYAAVEIASRNRLDF